MRLVDIVMPEQLGTIEIESLGRRVDGHLLVFSGQTFRTAKIVGFDQRREGIIADAPQSERVELGGVDLTNERRFNLV
jgi:hypothetical protein